MTTRTKPAFTMIEVLIVITIVGILAISLFASMRGQRQKAEDARVISDIDRLKIAFEDYYGDNNCYPPETWFDSTNDCNSNQLSPYVAKIPCDPRTNKPYHIERDASGCSWYKIYGQLFSVDHPSSLKAPVRVDDVTYNYGASSGNVQIDNSVYIPGHYYYYCSGINNCSSNPNPETEICAPVYLDDANCGGTADNKCQTVGACTPRR